MSVAPSFQTGYSAAVQLCLVVGERVLPLASVRPGAANLREAVSLPPTTAEIILTVDGSETRWPVYLPNGAVPFESRIEFENLSD